MSAQKINALLAQMQALQQTTQSSSALGISASASVNDNGADFKSLLKNAIQEVSDAQNAAQAKVQAFSTGESNMSLEEVMISLQKANLSFQGMLAVRNRLVEAYNSVTNLQV